MEKYNLSDAEKTAFNFIQSKGNEILQMSIYQIANQAFVSPATVTRLIHKLGYDNLQKFRLRMCNVEQRENRVKPLSLTKIENLSQKIINSYSNLINDVQAYFNFPLLSQIVTQLFESQTIIAWGSGTSQLPVLALQNQLIKLNIQFQWTNNIVSTLHSLNYSKPKAITLIFSVDFAGQTVNQVAKVAENNQIPIILITSNEKIKTRPNFTVYYINRTVNHNNFSVSNNVVQLIIADILSLMLLEMSKS